MPHTGLERNFLNNKHYATVQGNPAHKKTPIPLGHP